MQVLTHRREFVFLATLKTRAEIKQTDNLQTKSDFFLNLNATH